MAYRRKNQIEAHDASGYETEMVDFSDFDDGYGNQILTGDLSMQRLVERGIRDGGWPGEEPSVPVGYDTDPFQSQAQHRLFRAMEARGELPRGTASRWAHKTRGGLKALPERKGKK